MKLLVIDDDPEIQEVFELLASRTEPPIELLSAMSRDEAFALIERGETFDLVICDLHMPISIGDLDRHTDHGKAVYERLEEVSPGTPLLVFSGEATPEIVQEFFRDARKEDLFGTGVDTPMVDVKFKNQLTECIDWVEEFGTHLAELERAVELHPGLVPMSLSLTEQRTIKLYARRQDVALVRMTELEGGFSDSRTVRMALEGADGQHRGLAVAKIGDPAKLAEERHAYQAHVVGPLAQQSFALLVDQVTAGTAGVGALFYKLAEGHDRSLFDVLRSSDESAAKVVEGLRQATAKWSEQAASEQEPVLLTRQRLAGDELLSLAVKLDPRAEHLEKSLVYVKACSQHGDLHGENVLVNANLEPVLIDYAMAQRATASLDPVTLELSTIFHPSSPCYEWPSESEIALWADLNTFARASPYPHFVSACREWTDVVGRGRREVWANVYGYALRQLEYAKDGEPRKKLAEVLVKRMLELLDEDHG